MSQAGKNHNGASGPTSLLKQFHPRAHDTGVSRWFLNIPRERGYPQPIWVTCSSALSPALLPDVQVELPVAQFLPVASCRIAQHHQAEPGPSSGPFLQILTDIDEDHSQSSPLEAEQTQSSILASSESCYCPLIIFVAFPWTSSRSSVSLLHRDQNLIDNF
ncbi:hypothetical protein DUI87_29936 [Hirundo rustica rustica]|uniref:Uncharacterized protein n=1 Tax=Hirundo rustica rustica TaxID=333673 RepID=A0A3M0JG73_HIRRU|nr:hypothetical protein DUI87_29936 [Hirundo rustica rustica]